MRLTLIRTALSLNSVLLAIYPLKLLPLDFGLVLRPPIESTRQIGTTSELPVIRPELSVFGKKP
jgi:hypothetical protein